MEGNPENLQAAENRLNEEIGEVNKLKETLAEYGEKILHSIAKDPDSLYVFAPWGSGDVLAIAAHLSYIRKAYPQKKGLYLVCRKNCSDIADMYDSIDGCISVSWEECDCFTLASTVRHADYGENYILGDLSQVFHKSFPTRLEPFKTAVLRIPAESEPDPVSESFPAPFNEEEHREWRDVVILAPYAIAYPLLSLSIWAVIADMMKKKGYRVYTNVYGEETPVPGTEALRVSIRRAYDLSRYVAGMISYRSGFSDIMGTIPALGHIVIYPNEISFQRELITDLYPSGQVRNLLLSDNLYQEVSDAADLLFRKPFDETA